MKKRLPLIIILLLAFYTFACGDKIEPGTAKKSPPVVKDVSVSTARITDQPIIYEAVGTVQAGISSKLSSKLLGTVDSIRVREGDRVKKGEVLIILDQRQVKAQVRKAEAGLAEAGKALTAAISARDAAAAQKKLSFATYERYRDLKNQAMVSAQIFEEKEAGYQQAEAGLEKAGAMVAAARARVKQAEANLAAVRVTSKDAVITAPHDGIITAKLVDKGDLASPGTPLLTIETTRGFCVDMLLPETYIGYVKPRQKVSVEVPALKTGPLEGNVCTIVPSADQKSRSFIVKINLPIERSVTSGMFARVQIPTGRSKKLLINRNAVIVRGQ
ncbi:MAG: efflux RND transporter periplasmic adaptor subunit, partial [Deltaproteobacteria bacterium]|nr:efflux RND transporter periplasmic adaptor subunit [Deltaproteobacteria bacterium]